ncbi:hypothetical protein DDE74_27805 [Streptomyces lydicus]|uniref:RanBP2-type domain-containing protein n=1 Tax=Streptomyces lydicus TaxID=47763 RepID=A0A3Q9KCW3_9ACTN|nr:hypothetical protein DDE74_27805 [Streptomyces lydicus]
MPSPTWKCTGCATYNSPSRSTCLVCDAPKSVRPKASATIRAWACPDCETHNKAGTTACVVCDASWKKAAGAKKSPGPKTSTGASRPAGPRDSSGARKPAGPAGGTSTGRPGRPSADRSGTSAKRTEGGASGGSSDGFSTTGSGKPGTPRRTAGARPAGTRKTPAGSRTSRPRSSAPRPRPSEPAPLFFPPPAAPEPPAPPPPPPAHTRPTPPPYTTAPRRPASNGSSRVGCLKALGIAAAVLFLGPKLLSGCASMFDSAVTPGPSSTTASPSGPSCPSRIAAKLPDGEDATLIRAYRTHNKQITLCRTPGQHLYYYGEFTGRSDTGIVMRAKKTSDGYLAWNKPYQYEINGDTVTVTENGRRIGKEHLERVASPH